ncbi:MAG: hypothetical protein C4297_14025 [Gemmataceae bacterium]
MYEKARSKSDDIPVAREAAQASEQRAPVMTRAPEQGRKFPCTQCGARLDFDPAARALRCPYCGFAELVDFSNDRVAELDYAAYIQRLEHLRQQGRTGSEWQGQRQIRCGGCGAVVIMDRSVATASCPYCGTHLESPAEEVDQLLAPEGVVPFAVDKRQAIQLFEHWIGRRWFAPTGIKKMAALGQVQGLYVPFWTFDAMTYSRYTGMRGDDYYVTETYTERDVSGNLVTRTRQVRKTRWTYVSGEVDHFFDDVLVCASYSLPPWALTGLQPWSLEGLVNFQKQFLSGFRTERYTLTLPHGFRCARDIMDAEIRTLCCRDIGGDHQVLSSVDTRYVGVTFKYILLPVWVAGYRYHNKLYQFFVNGQTGKATGSRPYSWVKIVAFVLSLVALTGGLLGLLHWLMR